MSLHPLKSRPVVYKIDCLESCPIAISIHLFSTTYSQWQYPFIQGCDGGMLRKLVPSPEPHSSAPFWGFTGILRPDKLENPSFLFWVCPKVSYHLDISRITLTGRQLCPNTSNDTVLRQASHHVPNAKPRSPTKETNFKPFIFVFFFNHGNQSPTAAHDHMWGPTIRPVNRELCLQPLLICISHRITSKRITYFT